MPWCEHCDRYLTQSTVRPDFSCPWCGRFVDPGRLATMREEDRPGGPREDDDVAPPLPWHFKLLVSAVVAYLGLRAVQGVDWVLDRF
jgi:predicted RNA-binding Zn-ribbon protein involved in translation (DUF1610 family)